MIDAHVDPVALESLPIFPLPNCVLLPGGLLPLHVFEPRYRELARDCLEGHQLMGIARLRPGYEASYYGRPPVYERFGVGRIICSEELPDGRFVLLLKGVARVELDRELPAQQRTYRTAAVRRLADRPVDPIDANDHLERLVALCDRLANVLDGGGSQLKELVRVGDPGECADAVAAALVMDVDARQELLEAICPLARLQRTMGHVGHLLCELAPASTTVN